LEDSGIRSNLNIYVLMNGSLHIIHTTTNNWTNNSI
jgi:hypothetical protein